MTEDQFEEINNAANSLYRALAAAGASDDVLEDIDDIIEFFKDNQEDLYRVAEGDDYLDGDAESALASAGWGTDEDYGYYGE